MSVERSIEAWEELQRHGQDLAYKLAQGFTGLIQSHIALPSIRISIATGFIWPHSVSFNHGKRCQDTAKTWPNPPKTKLFDVAFEFPTHDFIPRDFGLGIDKSGINDIFILGIDKSGADFWASLNGIFPAL